MSDALGRPQTQLFSLKDVNEYLINIILTSEDWNNFRKLKHKDKYVMFPQYLKALEVSLNRADAATYILDFNMLMTDLCKDLSMKLNDSRIKTEKPPEVLERIFSLFYNTETFVITKPQQLNEISNSRCFSVSKFSQEEWERQMRGDLKEFFSKYNIICTTNSLSTTPTEAVFISFESEKYSKLFKNLKFLLQILEGDIELAEYIIQVQQIGLVLIINLFKFYLALREYDVNQINAEAWEVLNLLKDIISALMKEPNLAGFADLSYSGSIPVFFAFLTFKELAPSFSDILVYLIKNANTQFKTLHSYIIKNSLLESFWKTCAEPPADESNYFTYVINTFEIARHFHGATISWALLKEIKKNLETVLFGNFVKGDSFILLQAGELNLLLSKLFEAAQIKVKVDDSYERLKKLGFNRTESGKNYIEVPIFIDLALKLFELACQSGRDDLQTLNKDFLGHLLESFSVSPCNFYILKIYSIEITKRLLQTLHTVNYELGKMIFSIIGYIQTSLVKEKDHEFIVEEFIQLSLEINLCQNPSIMTLIMQNICTLLQFFNTDKYCSNFLTQSEILSTLILQLGGVLRNVPQITEKYTTESLSLLCDTIQLLMKINPDSLETFKRVNFFEPLLKNLQARHPFYLNLASTVMQLEIQNRRNLWDYSQTISLALSKYGLNKTTINFELLQQVFLLLRKIFTKRGEIKKEHLTIMKEVILEKFDIMGCIFRVFEDYLSGIEATIPDDNQEEFIKEVRVSAEKFFDIINDNLNNNVFLRRFFEENNKSEHLFILIARAKITENKQFLEIFIECSLNFAILYDQKIETQREEAAKVPREDVSMIKFPSVIRNIFQHVIQYSKFEDFKLQMFTSILKMIEKNRNLLYQLEKTKFLEVLRVIYKQDLINIQSSLHEIIYKILLNYLNYCTDQISFNLPKSLPSTLLQLNEFLTVKANSKDQKEISTCEKFIDLISDITEQTKVSPATVLPGRTLLCPTIPGIKSALTITEWVYVHDSTNIAQKKNETSVLFSLHNKEKLALNCELLNSENNEKLIRLRFCDSELISLANVKIPSKGWFQFSLIAFQKKDVVEIRVYINGVSEDVRFFNSRPALNFFNTDKPMGLIVSLSSFTSLGPLNIYNEELSDNEVNLLYCINNDRGCINMLHEFHSLNWSLVYRRNLRPLTAYSFYSGEVRQTRQTIQKRQLISIQGIKPNIKREAQEDSSSWNKMPQKGKFCIKLDHERYLKALVFECDPSEIHRYNLSHSLKSDIKTADAGVNDSLLEEMMMRKKVVLLVNKQAKNRTSNFFEVMYWRGSGEVLETVKQIEFKQTIEEDPSLYLNLFEILESTASKGLFNKILRLILKIVDLSDNCFKEFEEKSYCSFLIEKIKKKSELVDKEVIRDVFKLAGKGIADLNEGFALISAKNMKEIVYGLTGGIFNKIVLSFMVNILLEKNNKFLIHNTLILRRLDIVQFYLDLLLAEQLPSLETIVFKLIYYISKPSEMLDLDFKCLDLICEFLHGTYYVTYKKLESKGYFKKKGFEFIQEEQASGISLRINAPQKSDGYLFPPHRDSRPKAHPSEGFTQNVFIKSHLTRFESSTSHNLLDNLQERVYLLISSLLEFPNEGIFLYFTPQLILHFIQINNTTAWELPAVYFSKPKAFQHQHLLCSFFQSLGRSPSKSQTSSSIDTLRILSPFCCSTALFYNILRTAFMPFIDGMSPLVPETPARRSIIERSQMGFDQFEKFISNAVENFEELVPSITLSLQLLRRALEFTHKLLEVERGSPNVSADIENTFLTENQLFKEGTKFSYEQKRAGTVFTRISYEPEKKLEPSPSLDQQLSLSNNLDVNEGSLNIKRSEKRVKTERPNNQTLPERSISEEEFNMLKERARILINTGPQEYQQEKEDIVKKFNHKACREEELIFDFPCWEELTKPMKQILRVLRGASHTFLYFEAERSLRVLIEILKFITDLRKDVVALDDEIESADKKNEISLRKMIQEVISAYLCNILICDEEKLTGIHNIFKIMKTQIDDDFPLIVVRTSLQIIVDSPSTNEDIFRSLHVLLDFIKKVTAKTLRRGEIRECFWASKLIIGYLKKVNKNYDRQAEPLKEPHKDSFFKTLFNRASKKAVTIIAQVESKSQNLDAPNSSLPALRKSHSFKKNKSTVEKADIDEFLAALQDLLQKSLVHTLNALKDLSESNHKEAEEISRSVFETLEENEHVVLDEEHENLHFISSLVFFLWHFMHSTKELPTRERIIMIFAYIPIHFKDDLKKILHLYDFNVYEKGFDMLLKVKTKKNPNNKLTSEEFFKYINTKELSAKIEMVVFKKLQLSCRSLIQEANSQFQREMSIGVDEATSNPNTMSFTSNSSINTLKTSGSVNNDIGAVSESMEMKQKWVMHLSPLVNNVGSVSTPWSYTKFLISFKEFVEKEAFLYDIRKKNRELKGVRLIRMRDKLLSKRRIIRAFLHCISQEEKNNLLKGYAYYLSSMAGASLQRRVIYLKEAPEIVINKKKENIKPRSNLIDVNVNSLLSNRKTSLLLLEARRKSAMVTAIDADKLERKSSLQNEDLKINEEDEIQQDEDEVEETPEGTDAQQIGTSARILNKEYVTRMIFAHEIGIQDSVLNYYEVAQFKPIDGILVDSLLLITRRSLYIVNNYYLNDNDIPAEVTEERDRSRWVVKNNKDILKAKSIEDLPALRKQAKRVTKIIQILWGDITELRSKRYWLHNCGIEIITERKSLFLITFLSERQAIYNNILKHLVKKVGKKNALSANDGICFTSFKGRREDSQVKTLRAHKFLKKITPLWENGKISNFEYIMVLNLLAGRTTQDYSQYPIFPWILNNFNTEDVDYNDPATYRDLSKPIGALQEERAAVAKIKYFHCEQENREFPPFHYGSHYSNPMTVLYYLLRLMPFSKYAIHLQGGKFDLSDRLFHSLSETWNLANSLDFKELIPELYSLPEIFLNINNYHFGTTQLEQTVTDVMLPPWTLHDIRFFVNVHRKGLESGVISSHINEWFDLIFGYKQNGKPAIEALNVFYFLTYEGSIDMQSITEQNERCAILDQINEYGQCPRQLFTKAHPERKKTGKSSSIFYNVNWLKSATCSKGSFTTEGGKFIVSHVLVKEHSRLSLDIRFRSGLYNFYATTVEREKAFLNELSNSSLVNPTIPTNEFPSDFHFIFEGNLGIGFTNYTLNYSNFQNVIGLLNSKQESLHGFFSKKGSKITSGVSNFNGTLIALGTQSGSVYIYEFERKRERIVAIEQIPELDLAQKSERVRFAFFEYERDNLEENLLKGSFNLLSDHDFKNEIKAKGKRAVSFGGANSFMDNMASQKSPSGILKSKYSFSNKDEAQRKNKNKKNYRNKYKFRLKKQFKGHQEAVVKVAFSHNFSVLVSASQDSQILIWQHEKGTLVNQVYLHNYTNQRVLESVFRFKEGFTPETLNMELPYSRSLVGRELLRDISINEENGDFALVSDNYLMIYNVNAVLLAIANIKFYSENGEFSQFSACHITSNKETFEDDYIFTGHKDGTMSVWIIIPNEMQSRALIKKLPPGSFTNIYAKHYSGRSERSNLIQTILTPYMLKKVYEGKPTARSESPIQRNLYSSRVVNIQLTENQKRIITVHENGEYFVWSKIESEDNQNTTLPQKKCSICTNPIGLFDKKIPCCACSITMCVNCAKYELTVPEFALRKNSKVCFKCFNERKNKKKLTLYDNY